MRVEECPRCGKQFEVDVVKQNYVYFKGDYIHKECFMKKKKRK